MNGNKLDVSNAVEHQLPRGTDEQNMIEWILRTTKYRKHKQKRSWLMSWYVYFHLVVDIVYHNPINRCLLKPQNTAVYHEYRHAQTTHRNHTASDINEFNIDDTCEVCRDPSEVRFIWYVFAQDDINNCE